MEEKIFIETFFLSKFYIRPAPSFRIVLSFRSHSEFYFMSLFLYHDKTLQEQTSENLQNKLFKLTVELFKH